MIRIALTQIQSEEQERKQIGCSFLTSCDEIFNQLGGVLLYGRAELEIPLLKTKTFREPTHKNSNNVRQKENEKNCFLRIL